MITDWADRWLGGFCAVGALGGLPVRGPDYRAHPPLEQLLTLPPSHDLTTVALTTAQAEWSAALGGVPLLLLASVERARALLLQALDLPAGAAVGLPANADRALTETVKQHPARPVFLDLAANLALHYDATCRRELAAAWLQPYGGTWTNPTATDIPLLLDAGDSLPAVGGIFPAPGVVASIYGLHLSTDPRRAGALLVCTDPALQQSVESLLSPADRPDPALALAQLQRLAGAAGIAAQQQQALAAVRQGLSAAAGLPMVDSTPTVLAQAVAVRVPEPGDASTFYAYVLGEHTPVQWLPALRPLHYAALRPDGAPAALQSAAALARVLLVPVGPTYSDEEIGHAVLGITKAADYLGLRWYTDPQRATWYARQMTEWYGADHDAYRMVFPANGKDQT